MRKTFFLLLSTALVKVSASGGVFSSTYMRSASAVHQMQNIARFHRKDHEAQKMLGQLSSFMQKVRRSFSKKNADRYSAERAISALYRAKINVNEAISKEHASAEEAMTTYENGLQWRFGSEGGFPNLKRSNIQECTQAVQSCINSYVQGRPIISNFFYDQIKKKMMQMLLDISPDDEQSLGHLPFYGDAITLHSLSDLARYFDTMNTDLLDQNPERMYLLYPVINGVKIKIKYDGGVMQEASLEEDSSETIDILPAMQTISDVPIAIQTQELTIVRGTLFLYNKDCFALKNAYQKYDNATSGGDINMFLYRTLKNTKDPNKLLDLKLRCFFTDIENESTKGGGLSASDKFKELANLDFLTLPDGVLYRKKRCDVLEAIDEMYSMDQFEVSGVMIELISAVDRALLRDYISKAYYKFNPKVEKAVVEDVTFKVLDNGRIVAVMRLSPPAGGYTSKASEASRRIILTDVKKFEDLRVQIGDEAVVSYASPTAMSELLLLYQDHRKNTHQKSIFFPKVCPQCDAEVVTQEIEESGEKGVFCPIHTVCSDKVLKNIERLTSVSALSVPSLTRSVIAELTNRLLVVSEADIFSLNERDFNKIKGLDKKDFNKLLLEIKTARSTTLPRILYGLNIQGLTPLMADELAFKVGTLKNFLSLKESDLKNMGYLDPMVFESILSFVNDKYSRQRVDQLLEKGVLVSEVGPEIIKLCYEKDLEEYTYDDYENIIRKIQESNITYEITDFEFDVLTVLANKLEKRNPDWRLPRGSFLLKKDLLPLEEAISLKKTYSEEELKHLVTQTGMNELFVEPKINGVACTLEYNNGKLIRALSRYDKHQGQDISQSVFVSKMIPHTLSEGFTGQIRGELFLKHPDFDEINSSLISEGKRPYVDALSALVGSLLSVKEPLKTSSFVRFAPYHINEIKGDLTIKDRSKLYEYFLSLGFEDSLHKFSSKMRNNNKTIRFITNKEERQQNLPMSIDGMVIKPPLLEGMIKQIAFKYDQEIRLSRIKEIVFSLTKGGIITAVAEVEPTEFTNGRKISRVNISEQRLLDDIREGDAINIKYSGAGSPVMHSVDKEKRIKESRKITPPQKCPVCKHRLFKKATGVLCCNNAACDGASTVAPRKLLHFAKLMGITNNLVNKNSINKLFVGGVVKEPQDFFTLSKDDCSMLRPDITRNLMINIGVVKSLPLKSLVLALDIPSIGEDSAQIINNNISTFGEFINISSEGLDKMGLKRSQISSIRRYLDKNRNQLLPLAQYFEPAHREENEMMKVVDVDSIKDALTKIDRRLDENLARLTLQVQTDLNVLSEFSISLRQIPNDGAVGTLWHHLKRSVEDRKKMFPFLERYTLQSQRKR